MAEREPRVAKGVRRTGPASRLTIRQMVRPRLAYFAVALFAGMARGPLQADLLHLYAAFAYGLKPHQIG